MIRARNRSSSFFLVVLVVLILSGVGLVAATGSVAANHDSSANYTVHLPQEKGHYPKDSADTSIWHLAAVTDSFEDTSSPKGFEEAGTLVIESQAIDFSNCGTSNTAGFGIDRNNDDAGTETDQDLLQHREESSFNDHSIVVKFFDEGDLAGSPVSINADDQIVAVQNDCYNMPNEPGWYQIFGSLNGTGYDGNNFEVAVNSHYYYICECDSEQEARQTLGPPPSESGSESTPTPESSDGSTPTPTATPEPQQSTSTPTPTATPEPQQSTSTPASDASGDDPTATATPESAPQQDDDGGQQNQQGGDQQPAQRTATATGGSVPVTPTVAEGPGFGAAVALVALAGAALVALRRTR